MYYKQREKGHKELFKSLQEYRKAAKFVDETTWFTLLPTKFTVFADAEIESLQERLKIDDGVHLSALKELEILKAVSGMVQEGFKEKRLARPKYYGTFTN